MINATYVKLNKPAIVSVENQSNGNVAVMDTFRLEGTEDALTVTVKHYSNVVILQMPDKKPDLIIQVATPEEFQELTKEVEKIGGFDNINALFK